MSAFTSREFRHKKAQEPQKLSFLLWFMCFFVAKSLARQNGYSFPTMLLYAIGFMVANFMHGLRLAVADGWHSAAGCR